jgi:hypothetical protein
MMRLLRTGGSAGHRYWLAALMVLCVSGCAAYTATSGRVVLKDDSKEKSVAAKEKSVTAEIRFSASDRALIKAYYRKSAVASAAPGSLPMLRGGWLAADAKTVPLPSALERKLSALPSSHVRWIIGRDVILVEKKTRTIADAVYDVTN